MKKKGYETSAINSSDRPARRRSVPIQLSSQRLRMYSARIGRRPKLRPPTPAAAQILQGDLTSGYKSGYIFTIDNCSSKVTINGTDRSQRLYHYRRSANGGQDR